MDDRGIRRDVPGHASNGRVLAGGCVWLEFQKRRGGAVAGHASPMLDIDHPQTFAQAYGGRLLCSAGMAQKAAKSLAVRNASTLTRTHLISLAVYALFIFLRFTLLSRSLTKYIVLCLPAFVIEFYLDRLGRPSFNATDGSLRRAGEDLDAKGLTEFMWDILYWTWINVVLVLALGDRAWWLYLVVPGYSAYLAATTVGGLRGMMGGMAGAASDGASAQSNRQKKMEKRGGQKVSYR